MTGRLPPIRSRLMALCGDRRGFALTEFAFTVPILLVAYLGGSELSSEIACFRKVTTTARAMADLTTQYVAPTNANMIDITNASAQVMSPYPADSRLAMTITQVKVDSAGNATVDWSYSKNTNALATGTSVTLPTSLAQPSTYVIMANVSYSYTPMFGTGTEYFSGKTMKDTIYMGPRNSASITAPTG